MTSARRSTGSRKLDPMGGSSDAECRSSERTYCSRCCTQSVRSRRTRSDLPGHRKRTVENSDPARYRSVKVESNLASHMASQSALGSRLRWESV